MQITLELPDNIKLTAKEAKLRLAGNLYETGVLSVSQAAKLAGIDKKKFLSALSKRIKNQSILSNESGIKRFFGTWKGNDAEKIVKFITESRSNF